MAEVKLQSRNYILRGAICGLIIGNTIARFFFSSRNFEEVRYLADLNPFNIVIVLAFTVLGSWIGHIFRHQKSS